MAIFKGLPTVKKCCCCIGLKCGTLMIGIFGILSSISIASDFYDDTCAKTKSNFETLVRFIGFIAVVMNILMFIFSILLVVGVAMDKALYLTCYLYVAGLTAIVFLVFSILTIMSSVYNSNCKFSFIRAVSSVLIFLFSAYCIIVVNSYRKAMQQTIP